MCSLELDELRSELSSFAKPKKKKTRTPREERIIAGFEELSQFFEENKTLPQPEENKDIFERLYAVRLDKIKSSEECMDILREFDKFGLLNNTVTEEAIDVDNDDLLSELEELRPKENSITKLTHVKSKNERRAAEEIAQRIICKDFDTFKSLFKQVKDSISTGARTAEVLTRTPEIKKDSLFILFGQIAYVADYGETFINPQSRNDSRLRLIFDNGTESNLLMTSLQRALHKDESSRIISTVSLGPIFSDQIDESDLSSGLIYVLRSKSDHPTIKENKTVLHKIGVTGSNIEARVANAKNDPTYLMADVEVVATYKLSNINRVKLERIIHKFFTSARFGIVIKDRFGKPIEPREWYLVPLFIIDEAVERIKAGTILNASYDVTQGKIIEETLQ